VPKLSAINFQFTDNVDLKSKLLFFEAYVKDLVCSEEDCLRIECLSRNQANSDAWVQARSERITASNFGKVCKLKPSTAPENTVKAVLGYKEFSTPYTDYGQAHEDTARRKYVSTMKKLHPGLTVKKCGLLITPEYPYLGASPDGFVNCTHCEDHNGLLEIKSPASKNWRLKAPTECAMRLNFIAVLSREKLP